MIKKVFGVLILGLLVVFGCSQAPMREQVDASLPLSNAAPLDLNGAIARAKAENKLVFLDFTGSDWCPSCIELEKKVFSKPDFQTYAESNLVFLAVDFPLKFRLSPEAIATNNLLTAQFDVDAPPTLIALNGDGKQIWKHLGTFEEPKELISGLEAAKSKAK